MTVYCLDTSVRSEKHWVGQCNSKTHGCPTCLRAEKWRQSHGFYNTIANSHRFPEEIRYMTSAKQTGDYKKTNCRWCGHPWINHTRDCAGPCGQCKCSHFVKQDEEVSSAVPSAINKQGEENMIPYEYLVLLDDRENQKATVLVEPTLVLANNEEQVKLLAHRAVPEANVEDLNNIRVIIRRWSNSY